MIPSDYVWNLLFLTFFIPVYVVLLTLRLTELFVYSLHIIIICVAFLMLSNFNQIYILFSCYHTLHFLLSVLEKAGVGVSLFAYFMNYVISL